MRQTTRAQIERLVADGLTISEIARQAKVPQPTIWRIARGVHENPTERTSLRVDELHSNRFQEGGQAA